MIALLQRVSEAGVSVAGEVIARIGPGLLVLVGVEAADEPATASQLAGRVVNYRVFSDTDGKMNLSVLDIDGAILAVPQFTLAADTRRGRRPSFSSAAPPVAGKAGFDLFVTAARDAGVMVKTGVFGADMQVGLVNDGPVTFWLQTPAAPG